MFKLKQKFIRAFNINRPFSTKTKQDPYLILEVARNADWKAIKKSYFRLARLYHPDLNKNDERAEKKFLQVKEAYEHFERKYVPEKYANVRTSFSSKFDDETSSSSSTKPDSKSDSEDSKFESIREKNKKKNKRNSTETDFQFKHEDKIHTNFEDSNDYYRDQQLRNDIEKQKNISQFLFTRIPVPRSPKMVDRLNLKKISIGKGKMFGPDDYFSFSFITLIILFLLMDRKEHYKTFSFENLENVNIYNALKPSEVVKIYEDSEISPSEQIVLNSEEHQTYKHKRLVEEINSKTKFNAGVGRINDVPKVDIKKQFRESLEK